MIYYFLRPLVRIALIIYFRKIYINGLDNIPTDKPIIFSSNHPTAFIEPCLLACFLPLKLHFLVRGDLFSVGWLSWLLVGTNQIPIFRRQDAADNIKKNEITEKKLFQLFQSGESLLMFPEAHTHENIYLKPLKKGIARFALMDHETDLQIIPIGVNFDKNVKPNSKVSIQIGNPISINDFKVKAYENEAKKINSVIHEISRGMKDELRHIEDVDKESLAHKLFRINDQLTYSPSFPIVEKENESVFKEEKSIATSLDTDNDFYTEVSDLLNLDAIEEETVYHNPNIFHKVMSVVLIPILGVSLLINFIPLLIAKSIVANKVQMHEFKSPVFLSMMIFQYIIFTLVAIVSGLIWGYEIFIFFVALGLIGIAGNIYVKVYGKTLRWIMLDKHKKYQYEKVTTFFSKFKL